MIQIPKTTFWIFDTVRKSCIKLKKILQSFPLVSVDVRFNYLADDFSNLGSSMMLFWASGFKDFSHTGMYQFIIFHFKNYALGKR